MKKRTLFLPMALAVLLPAVAAQAQPASPAPTTGTEIKTPPPTFGGYPAAVCAICGVREKAGPEPVAATFEYQGKTYFFCKQACKEEFRLDPERWIKAAAEPAGGHEHNAKPRAGGAAVPT